MMMMMMMINPGGQRRRGRPYLKLFEGVYVEIGKLIMFFYYMYNNFTCLY